MLNTFSLFSLSLIGLLVITIYPNKFFDILILFSLILSYSFFMNQISFYRIKEKFSEVLKIVIIQSFIYLSLIWFYKNSIDLNKSLIFLSFSYFASFSLLNIRNYKRFFLKLDFRFLKSKISILKYCYPISFIALFNFMLSSMDQYFLNYFNYFEELPAYIANYNIAEKSIFVILSVISMVFIPKIFSKYNSLTIDAIKEIFKTTFVFLLISFVVVIVLAFNTEFLTILMADKKFISQSWIIPFIALGACLLGANSILSEVLTVQKKTFTLLIIYFLGIFTNCILNLIFIKNYGVTGAVFSTIFYYLIMLSILLIYIYNQYNKILIKNLQK